MTSIGELSIDLSLDTSLLDKQIAQLGSQYKDFKFSVSFDGKGLESEFKRYKDKFSRSNITIGLRFDNSRLDAEFKKYQDKFSRSNITIGLRFDNNRLDAEFKKYQDKFSRSNITIGLRFDNSRLDAEFRKCRDRISGQIARSPIVVEAKVVQKQVPTLRPRVDHSELIALNEHFNLKQKHAAQLNQWLARNPIRVHTYEDNPPDEPPSASSRRVSPKKPILPGFSQEQVVEVVADSGSIARMRSQLERQLSGINVTVASATLSNLRTASQIQSLPTQAQGTPLANSFFKEFEKGITGSISKGFKQASSGNIFGGLGSIVMAPLRGVMQGLFMGIGDPLGQQIGSGLSKGLNSALGDTIGSFELLAERSTEKAIAGVGGLRKEIVKLAEDNTYIKVVTQRLDTLKQVLDRYSIDLRPETYIRKIVEPEEATTEAASARFAQRKERLGSRKKAAAGLQQETLYTLEQFDQIKLLNNEIAKRRKLQQGAIATISQVSPLVESGKATAEQVQDLQSATAGLERVNTEIDSFNQTLNELRGELRGKIKQLASLGIEKDLSGLVDGLFDVTEALSSQLQAQQSAIATLSTRVKPKFITPESIRGKKLEKLTTKSAEASALYQSEIQKPDADVEVVQALKKRADAASRALELFQYEISDTKGLEAESLKTKARLDAVSQELAQGIKRLGQRLETGLPKALKRTNEAGKVQQVVQPLPPQGITTQDLKGSSPELLVAKIISEVARAESFVAPTRENFPKVQVLPPEKLGDPGRYNPGLNTIKIRQDVIESLAAGNLDDLFVEVLTHEIVHGFQHAFGKVKTEDIILSGVSPTELIQPTLEELKTVKYGKTNLAAKIESSTTAAKEAGYSEDVISLVRAQEADAYTRGRRLTPRIKDALLRDRAISQLESLAGFQGGKFDLKKADISKNTIEQIKKIQATLNTSNASQGIQQQIESIIVKAINTTESIGSYYKEIGDVVAKFLQNIDETVSTERIVNAANSVVEQAKGVDALVDKLFADIKIAEQLAEGKIKENVLLSSRDTQENEPVVGSVEPYQAIASQVAAYSNFTDFKIPELTIPKGELQETFDKTGTLAAYLTDLNKVALKPELLKHMQSGQKLDYNAVGISVHELRHAAQLGFGKLSRKDLAKGKVAVDLLVPTPEELSKFKNALEQSIAAAKIAMPDVPEDIIRAIEQDAYTFEVRYGQKIYDAIEDTRAAIEQALNKESPGEGAIKDWREALDQGNIGLDSGVDDLSGFDDASFLFDDAIEATEDAVDKLEDKWAALDSEFSDEIASSSKDTAHQLDALVAEVESASAQVSRATETAVAQGEQKLSSGIAEAAQAHQDLINKLADPGLTGEDIKEIAKLAEIPGRGAKGLKRKDREKLIAESVIKGETSPEALSTIVRAVETKRAKKRIYKDTGIPKPETDWAKKTAGDLAIASVEGIQDFGKRSQIVLDQAIAKAKTIKDPTERLEELDRIRVSIIGYQSAILEASGTQTDATAKKHLEMLRVRLQSDRKAVGLAMTAAQSEVTKSIAQTTRSKSPSLSSEGMDQSIRRNPGALFASGAFGGGRQPQPPLMEELEKEVEANAKRAAQLEQEVGKAMRRGLIARLKRFFGLVPKLNPNEIAAKAEEAVKSDIGGQADRAQQMSFIRAATEGIRRRIKAVKTGEGLRKATQVLERLAWQQEQEITQSVQQSARADIEAAIANTKQINQEFQQQQQRTTYKEREAFKDAIAERQAVRHRDISLFGRLGLKHGLFFQAPELQPESQEELPQETVAQKPRRQRRRRPELSLFNRIAAPGITRQTEILAMNAQSLLGDIEAQLAQANLAEKEAKLIERQIKTNEQRIEKITRRQLTEGGRRQYGMGRLSDKQFSGLESERTRLEQIVVEDKAKIKAGEQPRTQRKELVQAASSTKNAIAEVNTILGKESLTDKDLGRLGQLRTQLAQVFEQMQQPIPGNNFLAQFGLTIPNVLEKLGGLIKGFLAFQGVMFVQNQLRSFSSEAFQAAIAISNLKTSLNFSEGGMAQGAQALGFVRQKVEDLRIPLQSSLEGYAKLSASTRGTPTQGKSTRELFTGVSEAATVLGLTREQINNIYVALSQVAAKGVVSMEELRGQLGENLPGALTIAAQAMGMTQEQFMKLVETGQMASQDFLPRFAAALHANFGDAAKEASGNAQSALYNFQNSLHTLKERFGEAISPGTAAGLNAMSGIFSVLAKHGGELATAITALSVALAVQLGVAIASTLGTGSALDLFFLGIRKAVAGTWAAIAPMMGQMILTFGAVFAVIEGFKIASHYINGGELAQQFKQMEEAASRAAKGIQNASDVVKNFSAATPPPNNWLDHIILGIRWINEKVPALGKIDQLFGMGDDKFKTTAESDRDKAVASIIEAGKDIEKAQKDLQERLTNPSYNRGAIGSSLMFSAERMMGRAPRTEVEILKDDLKGVDDQLQQVSFQRKTLQAEIARNYTNLGKAVPPELKEQLTALSTQFQDLSTQRTDIAKPYQEQLQNVTKLLEQTKTLSEFINAPENAERFTGETEYKGKKYQLPDLKKQVQKDFSILKDSKNTLEALIQSTNADPVLTLTEAFRKLNLELANLQEKSAFRAASDALSAVEGQLSGFSTDEFYQGRGALDAAKKERDRINDDNQNLKRIIEERQELLKSGANQALMQQLGINENSTIAEIQNRIDTNKDLTDAEKGVLENLKKIQEDRLKLQQGLTQSAESEMKIKQQIQQNTIDQINWEVASRDAKIRQSENAAQDAIRKEQGKMGADKAVEELSKIPLQTTERQITSVQAQLDAYRKAYQQGLIDRRTYLEKERDLTTQLSDLRKQKVEQIEQQITDAIARHAAIREAIQRRDANSAMIAIRQFQSRLSPQDAVRQMEAQPLIQTDKSIQSAQAQLKEYREAFEKGQINAKAYADKERELTTQISDLKRQKVEQIEQQVTGVIARNTADRQALIRREESDAIASIRRRYLSRQITEKEAAVESAKISSESTRFTIKDVEVQLAAYQKAYKDGTLNAKDYIDKERDLTTQLHDLKKQQIEQEIALRDAANAKILEGIELANRLAEAQIQKFSDSQTQLIKQGQLEGRPEYVASRQLEQLQGETLKAQIADTKRKMGETDDLYRKGVITDPKQYTEQRLQLEQQLAGQQIQLLDNQIAQQKRLREEQTKTIDDRIRGQERSQELRLAHLDLQAKGIELQVKEVELIQKADDLSKQLLDSRHNLSKALSDAELGQTQIRLDAMNRGKDLMSKVLSDDRFTLNTSDVDIANLKAVLGSQLGQLGIGVDFDNIRSLKRSADMGSVGAQQQLNQYELAVLDARSRLEDELAAKKLNALGLEQEYQRQNLELELRKGEMGARSALFAAKQAEFQVQQSKLQLENQVKVAKLEEERAKLIEDPRDRVRAIADARAKLELATGQLDLVPDQLVNAQGLSAIASENVSAQEELALNARRAMEANQANERSQFVAAQNARRQAEQLERAEAAAKRTAAANASGSGGLTFTNLSYEQKQQLDAAMQTLNTYSGPMDENTRRSGLVSAAMSGNPFVNLLLRQQGDKDIVDIAEKMRASSNPFDLSRSQAIMSAQLNNRDVVNELQRLNENVGRLASEPRSISVSTATPVEDTLKIMSNVNRPY